MTVPRVAAAWEASRSLRRKGRRLWVRQTWARRQCRLHDQSGALWVCGGRVMLRQRNTRPSFFASYLFGYVSTFCTTTALAIIALILLAPLWLPLFFVVVLAKGVAKSNLG